MECQNVLSKLHSHGNVLIILTWNIHRTVGFLLYFIFYYKYLMPQKPPFELPVTPISCLHPYVNSCMAFTLSCPREKCAGSLW